MNHYHNSLRKLLSVTGFTLLLGLLVLPAESCKKKQDNHHSVVTCSIKYSRFDTIPGFAFDTTVPPETYTGFGKYITSITPSLFKAKFNNIRFQSDWYRDTSVLMEMLDNNTSFTAPERFANFTNGSVVTFVPKIWWVNKTNIATEDKLVFFKYFYWQIYWFYQELELPAAYQHVNLREFQTEFNYTLDKGDTAQKGTQLHSDHFPFLTGLFGTPPGGLPWTYCFGNTDSNFIFNMACQSVGASKDNPGGGTEVSPIVRSNQYEPLSFHYSETKDMKVSVAVTFDYQNLIQVYAGNDNIPYTGDDVFLYAPKFWNRLKVKVLQLP